MKTRLLLTTLSIIVLFFPKPAAGQCSSFGGRSTVVQVNGLVPLVLSDTGNLDSTGGEKNASSQDASVLGLVSGEVLFAETIGDGIYSVSQASVGALNLTVAGNTIGADFVIAHANADCGGDVPAVSGSSEIDGLVVNGWSIPVTGLPNQTISLPGGVIMILNEQTSSVQNQSGSMALNAIHIKSLALDVLIASPSASVFGPAGANRHQCDFFTGGGWIMSPSGKKATFGVSGGRRSDGTLFGHLEYFDHGFFPAPTGDTRVKVRGTDVLFYGGTGTARNVQGHANINGSTSCPLGGPCNYAVDVTDNDPAGPDTFGIQTNYFDYAVPPTPLGGGNIKVHSCQ